MAQHDRYDTDILKQLTRIANGLENMEKKIEKIEKKMETGSKPESLSQFLLEQGLIKEDDLVPCVNLAKFDDDKNIVKDMNINDFRDILLIFKKLEKEYNYEIEFEIFPLAIRTIDHLGYISTFRIYSDDTEESIETKARHAINKLTR